MKLYKLLLVAIVAVTSAPALGCYTEPYTYAVYTAPPAPREEYVVYRPGSIWVHGHWAYDGGAWRWHGGHYEAARPGYVYREGHWGRYNGQYYWHGGGWYWHG